MKDTTYQTGTYYLRGKHYPRMWYMKYLEPVRGENGKRTWKQRARRIGTEDVLKGEKAARKIGQAWLDKYINNVTCAPIELMTVEQASKKWLADVVPNYAKSSQSSSRSNIKKIVETFGPLPCREVNLRLIQKWMSRLSASGLEPKTVKNYIATFQMFWTSLEKWEVVGPLRFKLLDMPRPKLKDDRTWTPEQVQQIIGLAPEPYFTMFWIAAVTQMRGGEICGLFKKDILLDDKALLVKRSAFQGEIQPPKTENAVRYIHLSSDLTEHLRAYLETVQDNGSDLLFLTPKVGKKGGCPYDNGNVVKRVFKPILRQLGIDREGIGLHSLRHAGASAMDSLKIPVKVRMDRMGHGSEKMTMRYTHSNSQDHRAAADALGALFAPTSKPIESGGFVTSSAGLGVEQDTHTPGINAGIASVSTGKPAKSADSSSETVQTLAMGAD